MKADSSRTAQEKSWEVVDRICSKQRKNGKIFFQIRQILAVRRAPRQIPSNSVNFPSNSRQIPDPARAPPSNSVKFWRPAGPSVKSVKFRQIPSNFRPRWGPYYPPPVPRDFS